MSSLFAAIPYMAGGMITSAVMAFCSRSTKGAELSRPIYNLLSIDVGHRSKSSFIAGMLFIASMAATLWGFDEMGTTHIKPFEKEKLFFKGGSLIMFMISGLLIGFGLRLSNERLSNFAFYGVPRFSTLPLVAAGITFVFGALTATLRDSFPLLQGLNVSKVFNEHLDFRLSLLIPIIMMAFNISKNYKDSYYIKELFKSFGFGALLGLGLMMGGLARRHQMLDFLSFNKSWNPFLIFTFAGAFLGNLLMSRIFGMQLAPSVAGLSTPSITPKLVIGCALFGSGVGMSGLIPGSGLLVSAVYMPQIILFFLPFIALGQVAGGWLGRVGSEPSSHLGPQASSQLGSQPSSQLGSQLGSQFGAQPTEKELKSQ